MNQPMGRRVYLRGKFRAATKAAAMTLLLVGSINWALYALELSYPIQRGSKFQFERIAPHWIADLIYSLNIGGLILSRGWIEQVEHGSALAMWFPELVAVISGTAFWSVCVGAVVFWLEDPRKKKPVKSPAPLRQPA